MISKSLSTSQRFASLADAGELGEFCQGLYMLIVAHADDFGRLQGDPFTVKHLCHPSAKRDEKAFSTALEVLDRARLVEWYEVAGRRYLQVVDFEQHQSGLHKRTKSKFPKCQGKNGNSRKFPPN